MLNAGIIGCGNIAWKWDAPRGGYFTTHAKSYYHTRGVRLVACCDPCLQNAKGLARNYSGVSPYRDLETMLSRHSLDMVSVCAPTQAHYGILRRLLEGTSIKYILAEKPLASNVREAEEVISLAKKKRATIVVNYLRRWDETLCGLKDIIEEDGLGELKLGRMIYYGGFRRNGLHLADLLMRFGLTLRFVRALSGVEKHEGDFAASLYFTSDKGSPLYFFRVDEKDYPCLEIDLFYEGGRVRIGDLGDAEIFRAGRSRVYRGFPELILSRRLPSTMSTAMKNSVRHIVRYAGTGRVSYESLANEMRLMKLAEQVEKRIGR